MRIRIGTAGWSIPRQNADEFPVDGVGLARYAARFPAVEINSSFHRPHREATWQRWRDIVPPGFRFSVKIPKTITHQRKLLDCAGELEAFIAQCGTLGDKLAVLLVQLPPKLAFDPDLAEPFFVELCQRTAASVACEPRHLTWFTSEVDAFLAGRRIARVAADPAICDEAAVPGGWRGLNYWRLHGSPVVYRSSYLDRIDGYAARLQSVPAGSETWCIFDNTASSAGAGDALALMRAIGETATAPSRKSGSGD